MTGTTSDKGRTDSAINHIRTPSSVDGFASRGGIGYFDKVVRGRAGDDGILIVINKLIIKMIRCFTDHFGQNKLLTLYVATTTMMIMMIMIMMTTMIMMMIMMISN